MTTSFLDNFYGVLFKPDDTFNRIKEEKPIAQSLGMVIIISILGTLLKYSSTINIQNILGIGYSTIMAALAGIISWLFFAYFLDLISAIFLQNGKIKILLCLTGFALIPWMFLAPIELLKSTNPLINLFAIILGLIVWLWVTVLEIIAVKKSFNISFGRSLLLLTIPFIGGFLSFHWIIGFFATLGNIVKL